MLESRLLLTTIYVDAHATSATHNGVTWNTAYLDLQLALSAANSGDTIRIADGTYAPGTGTNTSATYQLKAGVTIQGGYAGFGAANPNARDIVANRTILDGFLSKNASQTFFAAHVVTGSGTTSTAVLDGVTVRDGISPQGGGIYNGSAASPTISNCYIESNVNGIYNFSSSPTISNCTFLNNQGGGMINVSSSAPTLTNCTFAGNYLQAGSNGGAMSNDHSNPIVQNCQFAENFTSSTNGSNGFGGAIYNTNVAAPTFTNCTFTRNQAPFGGAVYNASGTTPVFTGCVFNTNNAASSFSGTYKGGGVYNAATGAKFTSCTFLGNTALSSASSGGGAFYATSATALVNCVFDGNSATFGGGVYSSGASPTITNCTFTANSGTGSALYKFSTVAPTMVNCIAWANIGSNSNVLIDSATSVPLIVSNSDIQGGHSGSGNINADPVFADALGLDGIAGTMDDDLHIRASSPAVDAGDNTAPGLTGITTDRAGNARFVDVAGKADTGVGTAPIVDMGAFEAVGGMDADAFGTYRVLSGGSISLKSFGYSDVPGSLTFAWDFDADGQYDDATGPSPTFLAPSVTATTSITIGLQVTDSAKNVKTDTATLKVIPAVMYVDDSAAGANDGSSWTNAYATLATALSDAVPGTQIRVAQGTYKASDTNDWSASLVMRNGISVLGGYAGVGAANPDQRDFNANATILSGDVGMPGDNADNTNQIVEATGTDNTAILDGFTITAGNNWSIVKVFGSPAIHISAGDPTIGNCRIVQNFCMSAGALGDDGAGTFTNCLFQGNIGGRGGAGFLGSPSQFATGKIPTFIDCSFVGNISPTGGALEIFFASSRTGGGFFNCTFANNRAGNYNGTSGDGQGPAVYVLSGGKAPVFTNCILWGSTIGTSPAAVAQVYPSNTSITASYCDIQLGGNSGTGNINSDPLFVRSPSAGADALWGTADDDYGDLHLKDGSPAIDAGLNSAVPSGTTLDFDGHPRIADIPGVRDPGAIVDMGPYESTATLVASNGIFQSGNSAPSVKVSFSENLNPTTVEAGDLMLTNLTTGDPIDTSTAAVASYDATNVAGLWTFPGDLPDGNYHATLAASSVSDAAGNTLPADYSFDFFVLTADADHNRAVDTADFTILASNFNKTGRTYAQGDFNRDSKVNALDFNILATNFGNTLAPPSPALPMTSAPLSAPLSSQTANLFAASPIRFNQALLDQIPPVLV